MKYIDNNELAYVMLRYRQIHDFWHVLTGLGVSVEEEIALKWLEFTQTGLPMTMLSAFVGPLRLSQEERTRLNNWIPWAIQCGGTSQFMLNIYYEELLQRNLNDVRQSLGFSKPHPFHTLPSL